MTLSVRAGFIPLLDAAPLLVAAAKGFAEAEGLTLELARETSWATLRDRLAVRHLDAAHLLAPLAIASNLGLGPMPIGLVTPIALGTAGNTVTVSTAVWRRLATLGAPADFDATRVGKALAALVGARRDGGEPPLSFAIVHPYSVHHYCLADWLDAAGIDPRRDVDFVVVPPPLMADALATGNIDGFCVGEPWGSAAVARGVGCIATTSSHIWRASPDKVLAVRNEWAERNAEPVLKLVRAVHAAAVWCDDPAHASELLDLLAGPAMLAQPESVLRRGLERRLLSADGTPCDAPGFLSFAAGHATAPWPQQAQWLYGQMVRWDQVPRDAHRLETARATYRPDLYRAALEASGVPLPDFAREGAAPFDPRQSVTETPPA